MDPTAAPTPPAVAERSMRHGHDAACMAVLPNKLLLLPADSYRGKRLRY